jgi:hypothetical protein
MKNQNQPRTNFQIGVSSQLMVTTARNQMLKSYISMISDAMRNYGLQFDSIKKLSQNNELNVNMLMDRTSNRKCKLKQNQANMRTLGSSQQNLQKQKQENCPPIDAQSEYARKL